MHHADGAFRTIREEGPILRAVDLRVALPGRRTLVQRAQARRLCVTSFTRLVLAREDKVLWVDRKLVTMLSLATGLRPLLRPLIGRSVWHTGTRVACRDGTIRVRSLPPRDSPRRRRENSRADERSKLQERPPATTTSRTTLVWTNRGSRFHEGVLNLS